MSLGIGIFLQGLRPMREGPKAAAKLCSAHGISYVAMFAVQQGRRGLENAMGKPGDIDTNATRARYADAFHAAGIGVQIWGYPHAGREEEFIAAMASVAKHVGTDKWIVDPEVSYKGKPGALKQLLDLTRAATKEPIGFTSYGLPAYHKTFPWEQVRRAVRRAPTAWWGCPQLYLPDVEDSEGANKTVDAGRAQWAALGFPTPLQVPAVPAFGHNSGAHLNEFLTCFDDAGSGCGFLVWSWPSISSDEWRVLERWARRLT